MAWILLKYSKKDVNEAGFILNPPLTRSTTEISTAIKIVDNFRAAHAFPLNTMQNNLLNRARSVDKNCIIAKRLKRLPSIISKLHMYKTMRL
jgi:hypothetical protein